MFLQFDLVLVMAMGWYIIGTLDLIFKKNIKEKNTRYALLLLFIFLMVFIDHMIKPHFNVSAQLLIVIRDLIFLIGPGLYFYSQSLLKRDMGKKYIQLLHIIPYLSSTIFQLILQSQGLLETSRPQFTPGVRQIVTSGVSIVSFINLTYCLHIVIYLVLIQIDIHKHNTKILDFYSYKSFSNKLTWLRVITLISIPFYLIIFISILMPFIGFNSFIMDVKIKLSALPVLFMFLFTYFSRSQNELEDVKVDKKYKKSQLSEIECKRIYKKLLNVMVEDKLYLNEDLTLDSLSKTVNESRHSISQVINHETDANFYTFVNSYRINYFKTLIKADKLINNSILDLALECGFRSSSSFYNVFRKMENMTPNQYIKSIKPN